MKFSAIISVLAAIGIATGSPVTQVHLGVSNEVQNCPNGISIAFASDVAEPFTVTFSNDDKKTFSTTSTRDSYTVTSANGKYNYKSPNLHTAFMCNLKGNTKYQYTIVNGDKKGSFVTPPAVGNTNVRTILGVVGDPGDTSYSETTIAQLIKPYKGENIQSLIVIGDFSYANGEHGEWDDWFTLQENVTASLPLFGINGNHEVVTRGGHSNVWPVPADNPFVEESYLGYLKRVITPITEANKNLLRTYYSHNIGLIHTVFLDDYIGSRGPNTTVVGTPEFMKEREAQLAWLKKDLSSVNRDLTPWVVVFKHNPYYNTWGNHQCQCSPTRFEINPENVESCWTGVYYKNASSYYEPHCGLQAKLEDLYAEYSVDVVMSGHVHGYERTDKIYKNKVDMTKGTYYVTTGAGGNFEGHASNRLSDIPSWSLSANNAYYGGSRLIAEKNCLTFAWFEDYHTEDAEPVAFDSYTIGTCGGVYPTDSPTTKPKTTTPTTGTPTSTPSSTTPTTSSAPSTASPATTKPSCTKKAAAL